MAAHTTDRSDSNAYWSRIADWISVYRPIAWRPRHRYRDTDWGLVHELAITRDADIISAVIEIKRRRKAERAGVAA